MYKFFQCQKQIFLDSEMEIYYDILKKDQILLQCRSFARLATTQAGGIDSMESIPGLHKSLKIPAQVFCVTKQEPFKRGQAILQPIRKHKKETGLLMRKKA